MIYCALTLCQVLVNDSGKSLASWNFYSGGGDILNRIHRDGVMVTAKERGKNQGRGR